MNMKNLYQRMVNFGKGLVVAGGLTALLVGCDTVKESKSAEQPKDYPTEKDRIVVSSLKREIEGGSIELTTETDLDRINCEETLYITSDQPKKPFVSISAKCYGGPITMVSVDEKYCFKSQYPSNVSRVCFTGPEPWGKRCTRIRLFSSDCSDSELSEAKRVFDKYSAILKGEEPVDTVGMASILEQL